MNLPTENPFPVLLNNRVALIQMPPTLTLNLAQSFKDYIEKLCQSKPPLTTIILDFGKTSFLDSSGIGALIKCLSMVQKAQIVCNC